MNELVFQYGSLEQLRRDLLSESPREAAAILVAGSSEHGDRTRLLVRDVVRVPPDAYSNQTPLSVSIPPSIIAPVLKRARSEELSLVLAHTHPFTDDKLEFSTVDDEGEQRLMPSIFARVPNRPHGAIVLGTTGVAARLWKPGASDSERIDRVVEVGRELRVHDLVGGSSDVADDLFDRSVRAFGRAGQAMLSRLTIAIVGVGGTGSIVAEQLAHLGVRHLILLDPDAIERSNLNRVVGSSPDSVGTPKVEVAAAHVKRVAPDVTVQSIQGDVLNLTDADRLLGADLLFCCTDTHGSRAVLNQLAYQYLIPVIDMGVRIQVVGRVVESIGGRVQLLAPGFACLVCGGFLDPEQVRRDLLTPEARSRDPYIVGMSEPQPAVISLNGTVSSLAVTMMLSVVTGLPSEPRHQVLVGTRGVVRAVASTPAPGCVVCSHRAALARGDTWTLPGRPR